jgi:predicted enzyme related to lactoylglutathione lyase
LNKLFLFSPLTQSVILREYICILLNQKNIQMKDAIAWFEIPVTDFARAQKFYAAVTGREVKLMPMPGVEYGVFEYDHPGGGVGGGIVKMEGFEPSANGPLVYLPGGEDLTDALGRVEPAGGKIILPKTAIGENGFMAHFMDTEGNRIALHSEK